MRPLGREGPESARRLLSSKLHTKFWEKMEAVGKTRGPNVEANLITVIEGIGLKKVIDQIGLKTIIDTIGLKKYIDTIGLDQLAALVTPEQREELKQRLSASQTEDKSSSVLFLEGERSEPS